MNSKIILSSLKEGDFTLCSGQKSKYLFDTMKLIRNKEFLIEFHEFIKGNFIVGIEFGGAILASIESGYMKNFAIIRKDGTIYGNKIPKGYILFDDVVTTENTLRKAMEHLFKQTGNYPDEIKCIVDRRDTKNRSLHIDSMLEFNEE